MAPGSPIAQGTLQTRSPSRGASCLGQGCGLSPSPVFLCHCSSECGGRPASSLARPCPLNPQSKKTRPSPCAFCLHSSEAQLRLTPACLSSLFGFHISEKNLLGCISTCNSLLKRNKNVPRLKQIVTGGGKGRLYNGLRLWSPWSILIVQCICHNVPATPSSSDAGRVCRDVLSFSPEMGNLRLPSFSLLVLLEAGWSYWSFKKLALC